MIIRPIPFTILPDKVVVSEPESGEHKVNDVRMTAAEEFVVRYEEEPEP